MEILENFQHVFWGFFWYEHPLFPISKFCASSFEKPLFLRWLNAIKEINLLSDFVVHLFVVAKLKDHRQRLCLITFILGLKKKEPSLLLTFIGSIRKGRPL